MNEPGLLPSASPEQQNDGLWDKAPAWRNLVIGASLLTFVAVALPIVLPQADESGTPPVTAQSPVPVVQSQPPQLVPATAAPQVAANIPAASDTTPQSSTVASPTPVTTPASTLLTAAPQNASLPANAPAPQPAAQSDVCLLVLPPNPNMVGSGVVMSFEDRATSLARIQRSQADSGAKIDPDYIDNQRVTVRLPNGNYHVFLVPKTMHVSVGDVVTMQSNYRNVNLPCNYVPNLIVADLGSAANGLSQVVPVGTSR